ncbi:MAG: S16 family serine protease [archaeon]
MNFVTKFLFITLFSILIIPTLATASPYDINHITLLAVQETTDGTYVGSTADLYLELRDGTGRVFLDTSPLTKVDTQISTRYAKEIACNNFDLDCDYYDFIYTIRADSSIIGGPSAGAAIAALTAITVLDLDYDESIAITGTINSGGIIGPVGGVKEKIEAAANSELENITKVLVAMGSSENIPELEIETEITEIEINPTVFPKDLPENITKSISENEKINPSSTNLTLIEYANQELGIEVIEVMDLNEVVYILSGKELISNDFQVEVSEEYNQIMQDLSESLCNRAVELEDELLGITTIKELSGIDENNRSTWDWIVEKKSYANNSLELGDYYSAASFCFGLNVYLNSNIYKNSEISEEDRDLERRKTLQDLELIKERLNQEEIKTISDLQTKMVVEERLSEAQEILDKLNEIDNKENENSGDQEENEIDYFYNLAYAKERLYSALAWMHFFQMDGKSYLLNEEMLRDSCYQKIAEGEERYQYAKLYLPSFSLNYINEDLEAAEQSLNKEEYELCLMQASQAKASATSILSSLGVSEDNLDTYIESKSNAVRRELANNIAEDTFPILGYSYYQYAQTLQEEDPYSSLLYLEYSLELSELDIYFPEEEENGLFDRFHYNQDIGTFMNGLIQGLLIGALLTWLILQGARKRSLLR